MVKEMSSKYTLAEYFFTNLQTDSVFILTYDFVLVELAIICVWLERRVNHKLGRIQGKKEQVNRAKKSPVY